MPEIDFTTYINSVGVFLQGNYYLIVPITTILILFIVFLIYMKIKKIYKNTNKIYKNTRFISNYLYKDIEEDGGNPGDYTHER